MGHVCAAYGWTMFDIPGYVDRTHKCSLQTSLVGIAAQANLVQPVRYLIPLIFCVVFKSSGLRPVVSYWLLHLLCLLRVLHLFCTAHIFKGVIPYSVQSVFPICGLMHSLVILD